ncbi:MAG: hypothetical protein WD578_06120 [Bacteroidales bacterium]
MINALATTGAYLDQHATGTPLNSDVVKELNGRFFDAFEQIIINESTHNGWFTEKNVRSALGAVAQSLKNDQLHKWMKRYPRLPVASDSSVTIGVVMAGNIPLVGFHDMLSVIMSGHKFLGKPSSKDDRLLKMVAEIIYAIEPGFRDRIVFTEGYLTDVDGIIATGSNNTSRYFEYYFREMPHIIRRNRNGVAVLSGNETGEQLMKLGDDIFFYFGLGCRNITKIYVPEDYKPEILLKALENYPGLYEHHKYNNNLDYNRSVYLMNQVPFLDNGILLLKEDERIASPVGVVYFEKYLQLNNLIDKLVGLGDQIQCVVSAIEGIENSIMPGDSQFPELWDYADGIDTMNFLTELKSSNDL